jgi:hypothetical protein
MVGEGLNNDNIFCFRASSRLRSEGGILSWEGGRTWSGVEIAEIAVGNPREEPFFLDVLGDVKVVESGSALSRETLKDLSFFGADIVFTRVSVEDGRLVWACTFNLDWERATASLVVLIFAVRRFGDEGWARDGTSTDEF